MKRRTLTTLLNGYRADVLQAMARRQRVRPRDQAKATVVGALAAHLRSQETIRQALAELDAAALAALHILQRADGAADWEVVSGLLIARGAADAPRWQKERYGYGETWTPGAPESPTSRAFQDVMARLEVWGLALAADPARAARPLVLGSANTYHIPAEMWRHLPPPAAPPAAAPVAVAEEVAGDPAAFSRELYLVWSHLWHRPAPLTVAGALPKRAIKVLAADLPYAVDLATVKAEADLPRLRFVRRLLQTQRLVTIERNKRVVGTIDHAPAWWARPLAERLAACLAAWRAADWWNELQMLTGVTWQPPRREEETFTPGAVREARSGVTDALVHLDQADGWVGVDALLEHLFLTRREFLLGARPTSRFDDTRGCRYHATGNRYRWTFDPVRHDLDGWRLVEGGFAQACLACLQWMGLLDLGLDDAGAAVAWRLTGMGRHLLADGPRPEAADLSATRLVLQPNFHLLVLGPIDETTLLDLERFADRQSADRAVELVLTRQSLYRAQQAGISADAVLRRIADLTGSEVPQNVARTLSEWQSQHERVVVRVGVTLVQAADPGLLDEVLAQLGPALAAVRLSETVATVHQGRATDELLATALARLDLTAREATGARSESSVTLDEEGWVHPRQRCPIIPVLGRLQRLADQDGPGGRFRLTRASVQRAVNRHGLDTAEQIKLWESIHAGPVPDWLAGRIKAWGGHYGTARLSRPVVLELPDAKVLAELRAHPELGPRLRAPRSPAATALVDEAELATVLSLLAELGVEVSTHDTSAREELPAGGRTRRGRSAGARRGG